MSIYYETKPEDPEARAEDNEEVFRGVMDLLREHDVYVLKTDIVRADGARDQQWRPIAMSKDLLLSKDRGSSPGLSDFICRLLVSSART